MPLAEATVKEQPVPNYQQLIEKSRREATSAPNAEDLFVDDDLLLGIDLDERTLSGQAAATAEKGILDDSNDDALFTEPELLVSADPCSPQTTNLTESVAYDETIMDSVVATAAATVDLTDDHLGEIDDSIRQCSIGTSFLDVDYKFKMRGISLVTIDQLSSCSAAVKAGRCFIVKCEIDDVFEKLRVTHGKWKIGVIIRDLSVNTMKVGGWIFIAKKILIHRPNLQLRICDNVLDKLTDMSAVEIEKMRLQCKERPQIKDDLMKVSL